MPATATPQELFHEDYQADPKDWQPAKLLIEEIEREITERRTHLLRRLSMWIFAHRVIQSLEDRRLVLRTPGPRDLEFHRAFITFLLGVGEMLILELKEHDEVDPQHIGLRFEDVAAMVQGLRDDLQMWHGDMTEARRKEILHDVFGIAE
jgi:hypothetical protein